MSSTAVALVLLSALIHAGWNLLAKSSANPPLFSAAKGIPMLVLGIVFLARLPLADLPPEIWAWVVLSGLIHSYYVLALSRAYESGDISYVYPIVRSAPAFVPIAAFFLLGEQLSLQGGLGIVIVVACILMLQTDPDGRHAHRTFTLSPSRPETRWALLTLAMVVAYTLVDKSGMSTFYATAGDSGFDPTLRGPTFFFLQVILCYLVYWSYLFVHRTRGFVALAKQEWPKALAAGLGTIVSYSLILHVMQNEPVSYIVTLRQSSILVATAVGWLVLHERQGGRRMAICAVLIVGLTLVATAD